MSTLTTRQRRLRKRYTKAGFRNRCVKLQVGSQGFTVADIHEDSETDRRKTVAFYRDMLAIALDRLLTNEGDGGAE